MLCFSPITDTFIKKVILSYFMVKKEKGSLKIILNLVEQGDKNSFLPPFLLLDWKGFYKENLSEIQKALSIGDRGEILKVLYFSENEKTNAYELAKLTKHAYSLINRYVKDLEKLRLIKMTSGKSEGGRPALIIERDARVTLVPYSKFIESKDFEESVNYELVWAKKSEEKFKEELKKEQEASQRPKTQKS